MEKAEKTDWAACEKRNLAHLGNVRLEARVELGRKDMKLSQVRQLQKNDVIQLDKLAGETFTLRLNGVELAEGLISVVGDNMSLRILGLKALNQEAKS